MTTCTETTPTSTCRNRLETTSTITVIQASTFTVQTVPNSGDTAAIAAGSEHQQRQGDQGDGGDQPPDAGGGQVARQRPRLPVGRRWRLPRRDPAGDSGRS